MASAFPALFDPGESTFLSNSLERNIMIAAGKNTKTITTANVSV